MVVETTNEAIASNSQSLSAEPVTLPKLEAPRGLVSPEELVRFCHEHFIGLRFTPESEGAWNVDFTRGVRLLSRATPHSAQGPSFHEALATLAGECSTDKFMVGTNQGGYHLWSLNDERKSWEGPRYQREDPSSPLAPYVDPSEATSADVLLVHCEVAHVPLVFEPAGTGWSARLGTQLRMRSSAAPRLEGYGADLLSALEDLGARCDKKTLEAIRYS